MTGPQSANTPTRHVGSLKKSNKPSKNDRPMACFIPQLALFCSGLVVCMVYPRKTGSYTGNGRATKMMDRNAGMYCGQALVVGEGGSTFRFAPSDGAVLCGNGIL